MKDEIEYVWKQRWRFSTFLYVLCRYALVTNTLYALSISQRIPGMRVSDFVPLSNGGAGALMNVRDV
jgi:hypothetical protein